MPKTIRRIGHSICGPKEVNRRKAWMTSRRRTVNITGEKNGFEALG